MPTHRIYLNMQAIAQTLYKMIIKIVYNYPGNQIGILFSQTLNIGNKIRHPAGV